jgi:hypothetical protein
MVVFVAAGFSLRRTGETPVPPRKVRRKIFDWSQLGIRDFLAIIRVWVGRWENPAAVPGDRPHLRWLTIPGEFPQPQAVSPSFAASGAAQKLIPPLEISKQTPIYNY